MRGLWSTSGRERGLREPDTNPCPGIRKHPRNPSGPIPRYQRGERPEARTRPRSAKYASTAVVSFVFVPLMFTVFARHNPINKRVPHFRHPPLRVMSLSGGTLAFGRIRSAGPSSSGVEPERADHAELLLTAEAGLHKVRL